MGARSGRGPITANDEEPDPPDSSVRSYLHRWAETAGARLLVVDPGDDSGGLADTMAGRGVHVHWVGSTIDGLIEFGRLGPHVVVVSPDAPGVTPPDFVAAIRRHGSPFVVAGLRHEVARDVGPLMLAGASGVATRPYSGDVMWELLTRSGSLDEHVRVSAGPIELDASAYQVWLHGERIADLPLKEFELLRTLLLRAPGIVTDDELRDALWGDARVRASGRTIAMHVTRLRARLGDAAVIRRIRGRGYSLLAG